jgi:hypothetical protein
MFRRLRSLLLLATLLAAPAAGCAPRGAERVTVVKKPTTVQAAWPWDAPYAATITWREFDGYGDPERAVYVYDGEEVGRGHDGLEEVLRRLRRLPAHSRVLMHPSYSASQLFGYRRYPPYRNRREDLFQIPVWIVQIDSRPTTELAVPQ